MQVAVGKLEKLMSSVMILTHTMELVYDYIHVVRLHFATRCLFSKIFGSGLIDNPLDIIGSAFSCSYRVTFINIKNSRRIGQRICYYKSKKKNLMGSSTINVTWKILRWRGETSTNKH